LPSTFRLLCRFVAVDGTFLKGRFVQTLLLAVSIDANGHNTLLAWGVVESENRLSWEWFFLHLQRAIPHVLTEACTVISDRDKGLLEAERILSPVVETAWCCLHILANFKKAGYTAVALMFWAVVRARMP
jgi:transposase-like protein